MIDWMRDDAPGSSAEFGPEQMRARADRCEALGNDKSAQILRTCADEIDALNRVRQAEQSAQGRAASVGS